MDEIQVDETMLNAIIRSTFAGLEMAGVTPTPVGYSVLPARVHEIAVVIGMVGRRNGTVGLNLSGRAALFLANKLTDADAEEISGEIIDAVGEITNIVAGRLKAELGDEKYGISNISCPAVIVGGDYQMYHFPGFKTVSVEFEIDEIPTIFFKDRLFSTTVSISQA